MISILVPSRDRSSRLSDFVESVYLHADNPNAVEIIVRLDEDDHINLYAAHHIHSGRKNMTVIVGPPNVGMGVMTNECLQRASGGVIMLAGDDLVIRTPGFDTFVESLMPADGVGLIYGNDGLQGENLATHPFIGRGAINTWGGKVCPDEYKAEYIDTHIFDTFCRLGALGHTRIWYAPDLITEHLHHLNGKAPIDETYVKKMGFRESNAVYERLAPRREADALAMKRRIEGVQE